MNDLYRELIRKVAELERKNERLEASATAGAGEWVLLDETVLTGAVASVTFASIPGTYRTLVMVASARTARVAEDDLIYWRANGDSGNNYDYIQYEMGSGGVATSVGRAATAAWFGRAEGASSRASSFAPSICYWPNYASASIEKYSTTSNSVRMGDVSADADIILYLYGSRWRSTAAITSIALIGATANFVTGCIFTLYGIL